MHSKWPLKYNNPQDLKLSILLSIVTIVLLVISGWLCGKVVCEPGVGVDTSGVR